MPSPGWLERLLASPRWDEIPIWALDLETTGLRAGTDGILSVGMVPIRGGVIRYGERYASLVRPAIEPMPMDGIGAHHILPAEVASAPSIADVLIEVDRRLREGVLLLHFKSIDLAFLRDAYRRTGFRWPRPRVIDTVELLFRLHERQQRWSPHPPPIADTSLGAARSALGLPVYPAHDATMDALATAELFLALRSRLGIGRLRSIHR